MNQRLVIAIGAVAAVLLIVLWGALFTVHQTKQALILQFGNPVRVIHDPGLNFKVPFIQQVELFERRVLDFDAEPVELILGDQKRLVVDVFSRYRIEDPLRFRQSVGSEAGFRSRFEPIVFSALRSVLGEITLFTILSEDRMAIMADIQEEANRALEQFGVVLVDVRIKRADLPQANNEAIYRRMESERQREAAELRAEGAELAQRIRARADRERRVLIAEAEREGEIMRGEGDAEAIRLFAEAFSRDVHFFNFYRSMQAYRTAFADQSTSFVLSPNSEFFRFFRQLDVPTEEGEGIGGSRDLAEDVGETLGGAGVTASGEASR